MRLTAWGLALTLLFSGDAVRAANAGPVLLTLRRTAVVDNTIVQMNDVVSMEGGDAETRARIAGLDLAELPGVGPGLTLSRKQLECRLQLAGFDGQYLWQSSSPSMVQITRSVPRLLDRDVIEAARDHLLQQLDHPPQDVLTRLTDKVVMPKLTLQKDDRINLTAEIPAGVRLLGSVNCDVGVMVNGVREGIATVRFDVRLLGSVAVAARRIERGELLTEENLREDRRPFAGSSGFPAYAECVAGKRAKRALVPGQLLASSDVEAAATDNPILVKTRQQVRLIVRLGTVHVTATGEALQDGRAGQLIRVRNIDSKKTITGKVIGEGIVEIER